MRSAIASHVSDNNPATATTTGLRVDPLWREQAACLSVDPELFFPDFSHEVQTPAEVEAQVFDAQVICAGCPVRAVLGCGEREPCCGFAAGRPPGRREPPREGRSSGSRSSGTTTEGATTRGSATFSGTARTGTLR